MRDEKQKQMNEMQLQKQRPIIKVFQHQNQPQKDLVYLLRHLKQLSYLLIFQVVVETYLGQLPMV